MRKKSAPYAIGVYVRAIACKICWQKELGELRNLNEYNYFKFIRISYKSYPDVSYSRLAHYHQLVHLKTK
jgi:hypothetical protein